MAEEAKEEAIGEAEETSKEAGREAETRLDFLARMYAANKAKQAEEAEKAKENKQAEIEERTEGG